jgi:hypothetical protein
LVFLEKLFNELTVSEAIGLIDQHELVVPKFGE